MASPISPCLKVETDARLPQLLPDPAHQRRCRVTDIAKQVQEIEFLVRSGATYDLGTDVGSDILDGIDAFLARFIVYPNEHARHTVVLWIAHTWFMDVWRYTPRLLLLSPEPDCGKTESMKIAKLLVPHGFGPVDDASPAAHRARLGA
jgi:hypothetical protein